MLASWLMPNDSPASRARRWRVPPPCPLRLVEFEPPIVVEHVEPGRLGDRVGVGDRRVHVHAGIDQSAGEHGDVVTRVVEVAALAEGTAWRDRRA